jgi:hypothetical protein
VEFPKFKRTKKATPEKGNMEAIIHGNPVILDKSNNLAL